MLSDGESWSSDGYHCLWGQPRWSWSCKTNPHGPPRKFHTWTHYHTAVTEWMRHREEKGGEGQGGPGVCRLWDLCKTLGFYSEWDGKLKEPAFTTPALARQSPEDREKNSPLPGAPRAVQCPPTNSDLHCRTGPPTSTRGWTGTLCLTCMLCSDEDLLHTGD